jgi:uncharacterized protein
MTRHVIPVTVLLLIAATICVAADQSPKLLHVSGQATIYVKPDNVRVHVGVRSISSELSAARQENAKTFDRVLEAIAALKYEDMTMKSVGFDVSTIVEDKNSRDLIPPKIIGYEVKNELTIRVTNAPPEELSRRAATIIDTAVFNGANEVGGLEIFVKDQDKYQEEAMLAAAKDARQKAHALAATLDLRLVGFTNVSVQDVGYYQPQYRQMQMMNVAPSGAGGGATTAIEAGLVQITARVNVVCEIAGK